MLLNYRNKWFLYINLRKLNFLTWNLWLQGRRISLYQLRYNSLNLWLWYSSNNKCSSNRWHNLHWFCWIHKQLNCHCWFLLINSNSRLAWILRDITIWLSSKIRRIQWISILSPYGHNPVLNGYIGLCWLDCPSWY